MHIIARNCTSYSSHKNNDYATDGFASGINRKPFIEMNGLFCSTFCLCKKNEMAIDPIVHSG